MAEFENQTELRLQVIAALAPMIPELEKWRSIWQRIDDQKKIDWLVEGRSMFISAAGGLYVYLRPFFKALDDEIDRGEIELDLTEFKLRRPE